MDEDVRIILVSAGFSTELTTSVKWLNEYDIDLTCIRLKPYKLNDEVLIEVVQIIPLPEDTDYKIKLQSKKLAGQRVQKSLSIFILLRSW